LKQRKRKRKRLKEQRFGPAVVEALMESGGSSFSFSILFGLRTQLQRKMRRKRTRTACKQPMLCLCSASTLSIPGRFPGGGGSQAGSSQAGRAA